MAAGLRICVFGAGAIGGFIAASLARAGTDVVAVMRGAQLEAVRRHGVTVRVGSAGFSAAPRVVAHPADVGPVDIVLVTLKGHALPAAVPAIRRLLGRDTALAFLQNGIPWWYGAADRLPPQLLARLDPGGAGASAFGPERVIGGVAYCSATIVAPGEISLDYANVRFEFGAPDGATGPRLEALVHALAAAGVPSETTANIRERIWAKLVLLLASGPPALLSQRPIGDLFALESTARIVETLFDEAVALAHGLGFPVEIDREAALRKLSLSRHRPSILQDLEAGRPMEIDALYAAPLALGRSARIATPLLERLVGLVTLRAEARGLYAR